MGHVGNVCRSMHRYFSALEQMGNYDKRETINLLIYLFIIGEIYEGRLGQYLDDEGLAQFEKVLRCLYKGCLINTVTPHVRYQEPRPYYVSGEQFRYSETMASRITDDNKARKTERKL